MFLTNKQRLAPTFSVYRTVASKSKENGTLQSILKSVKNFFKICKLKNVEEKYKRNIGSFFINFRYRYHFLLCLNRTPSPHHHFHPALEHLLFLVEPVTPQNT